MSAGIHRVREALPGYDVGEEVGRGGCGVVLAGTHRRLGRSVAIKQIPPGFADDAEVRRRFVDEARVMAAIDHPHVVRVFDYLEHEGLCLLIMEFLPGGTVGSRFHGEGFAATSAVAVGLACAAGLHAAHRHGILHRDVKPANLMFGTGGAVKLTDFGIAKIVGGDQTLATKAGEIIGTPSYMAPEQILGEELSPATDVYSLATMLYQLLSGVLPFPPADSTRATLLAHAFGQPVPLAETAPRVPQPIAEVVMRGLATDPAQRFASAEDFGIALAEPAAYCWGGDWLTPVGIPVIGADTIVAAATGGGRRIGRRAGASGTVPRPGDVGAPPSGMAAPPTAAFDAPGVLGHSPSGGTGRGPVGYPTVPHRPGRPGSVRAEDGPPKQTVAGAGGSPTRQNVGTWTMPAPEQAAATSPRVRPKEEAPSGVRLIDIDRDDMVPIREVMVAESPRIPLVIAAVLAATACAIALLGLGGPAVGGDLAPGAVTLSGADPVTTTPVLLDLSAPIPLQVDGIDADAARLSLNVLGARLGGSTTALSPGTPASLAAPVNPYVLAGATTGELTLLRGGTEIATQRIEFRTRQRSTTTGVAVGVALLALFAIAYLESNFRALRRGRGGPSNTAGLVVSASATAVAVVGAAWVLLEKPPTGLTLVTAVVAAAAASVAAMVAARRMAERYRHLRRRRLVAMVRV
ncbi:serine/threonine-protein kinase [Nocardia bhagyanarayanae]|uniref:serine/threonine-protein kinase n=1 Tax=Nocardia bhagyanarayanae TaxID=1215925 RepID=UPI001153F683|nr:serine/threonine-protein kinase [Nocardia bhagyanarayanae]